MVEVSYMKGSLNGYYQIPEYIKKRPLFLNYFKYLMATTYLLQVPTERAYVVSRPNEVSKSEQMCRTQYLMWIYCRNLLVSSVVS